MPTATSVSRNIPGREKVHFCPTSSTLRKRMVSLKDPNGGTGNNNNIVHSHNFGVNGMD
eukprot:CAMPEP_0201270198 /NCGR_PEP_ID=MMETSP0853-20130426/34795_1 /ASSEMBLY_ACC=CAM_ASM_000640 /TAXON_ID=183588 /ORGANISM="Pseudo-nitzschia fraudulenta, Strain WWA7" /LENGTH=58 /DNA_ID=CAMNT_0047576395 /DNA_START=445 /DNA_END=618 /DNA_ORIENTATION=-